MFGKLYIVATPIGNLEDITLRAKRILSEVDIILAEDTRVTKKLTSPSTKLISYHQHSSEQKKLEILKNLIEGKNIALVTDAGTPGISDPGNELIDYLLDKEPKIGVVPIPGPSSLTAALSVCGFDVNKFKFLGFFPKKKRTKVFEEIKEGKIAYVYFDSPKRVLKTLSELLGYTGSSRRVFVGRELTKKFESVYRGEINDVLEKMKTTNPKGEVVVVVEKRKKK